MAYAGDPNLVAKPSTHEQFLSSAAHCRWQAKKLTETKPRNYEINAASHLRKAAEHESRAKALRNGIE